MVDQTMHFTDWDLTGLPTLYSLTSTTTLYIGADPLGFSSDGCACSLARVRLYLDLYVGYYERTKYFSGISIGIDISIDSFKSNNTLIRWALHDRFNSDIHELAYQCHFLRS